MAAKVLVKLQCNICDVESEDFWSEITFDDYRIYLEDEPEGWAAISSAGWNGIRSWYCRCPACQEKE